MDAVGRLFLALVTVALLAVASYLTLTPYLGH